MQKTKCEFGSPATMYGHPRLPHTPDPWAEVQEIPPYRSVPITEVEPCSLSAGCWCVAATLGAVAFAVGYFGPVWGWF